MTTNKHWQRWFWGLFFIVCAGILGASQLGLISYHLGFWSAVWTLLLAAAVVKSLFDLSAYGLTFSLAFLAMLYAKTLGISKLVPWTVLLIALLAGVGLDLLIQPLRRKFRRKSGIKIITNSGSGAKVVYSTEADSQPDDAQASDADVTLNVKMSSISRYVKTDDFRRAEINVKMGEAQIYFDQAKIQQDSAVIALHGSIGEVHLYLPAAWQVTNQLSGVALDMDEAPRTPDPDGPKVLITGDFSIGDVEIKYV